MNVIINNETIKALTIAMADKPAMAVVSKAKELAEGPGIVIRFLVLKK